MAKIVVITTGLTGILNASFELVNRLQQAGHECVCASTMPVEDKIEAQGFSCLPLDLVNFDPAPDVPNYKGPLRKVQRLLHKIIYVRERRKQAVKALGMDAFMKKIKGVNPDLVIIDIELHEHIMTLVTSPFKVLLLSQWFSTWNRKGLPPIVSDIIPGEGKKGIEQGIQNAWDEIIQQRKRTFLKKKLTSVFTDRRSILQLYAQQIGFSKKYIPENYWPGPFSYDQLPVISITDKSLEFPHDFRPDLTYVGSMVYVNRKEEANQEINEKLTAVFKQQNEKNKKLIYCSVSTFKEGDKHFLKNVIKACKGQHNWLLIISLGGLMDANEFHNLPENVYAFLRVPQLEVLKRADLSINHGGIHTINECLHFRVPMLVYSGKRSDQSGCAARVHYHGVGIMGDKDIDESEEIRKKIEVVLNDRKIQESIDQLGKTENVKLEKFVASYII